MYAELRYRLLSYNYSLAWEARKTGLPFMRAMWLHFPDDETASALGNQYMWGGDILVAPVYRKGAASREVYLPQGYWYDWWTHQSLDGNQYIEKEVDLATMPLFVRAGAILPFDPVRQYTGQATAKPLTLKVFSGRDGKFTLYEDDGESLDYLKGKYDLTEFTWHDGQNVMDIEPVHSGYSGTDPEARVFLLELVPEGRTTRVSYRGNPVKVKL
jgi:alpha-glucosidase/alpha-D-xyloside xylohydrolase